MTKKASNQHIREAGTTGFLHFSVENDSIKKRLINDWRPNLHFYQFVDFSFMCNQTVNIAADSSDELKLVSPAKPMDLYEERCNSMV